MLVFFNFSVPAVASYGPANQSTGNFGGSAGQTHTGSLSTVLNTVTADNSEQENDLPQTAAELSPTQTFGSIIGVDQEKSQSSSEPFPTASASASSSLVPIVPQSVPLNFCFGDTSDIGGKVGSQWIISGVNLVKGDGVINSEVGDSLTSKSEKSESLNATSKMINPSKSSEVKENQFSQTSQPSSSSFNGSLMSSSSSSQPPSGRRYLCLLSPRSNKISFLTPALLLLETFLQFFSKWQKYLIVIGCITVCYS